MLVSRISSTSETNLGPGEDFTLACNGKVNSKLELTKLLESLNPRGGVIGVHAPDGPLLAASVLWILRLGLTGVLLHWENSAEAARALACQHGCTDLLQFGNSEESPILDPLERLEAEPARPNPGIGLFTSGTTGEPKLIWHTWDNLLLSVAIRPELRGTRWLSLYPLSRFAGFNTLLHALFNQGALIVPVSRTPEAVISELLSTRPTHAAGTPTLWRNILMAGPPREAWGTIRQISLGGEPVDQQILSALRQAAPQARLTHIYASTELGVCAIVSDGLAGFPAQWLDDPSRSIQLTVRGSELWVKHNTRGEAAGAPEDLGWQPTGDVAEVRHERVFIKGRHSDLLNVGGAKVLPSDVEKKILEIPGVLGARVYGKASSISGTLLMADVLGTPHSAKAELRADIFRYLRANLPSYAIPRMIEFIDSMPVSASGKTLRER